MELRQIRYFLAVADELHFGKAAQRMHVAEQPLGYQVRKLEQELGFKLFDRTTRSVSLTPAGATFRRDATKIVEMLERAADTARRIAEGEAGVVRLGYESSTVPSVLPLFVKLFRAEYPEIELVLTEYSKRGLGALADGSIDACLVTRFSRLPSSVCYVPVLEDRAVVALPADHLLAGRRSVRLADLSGELLLGYVGAESESVNAFMLGLAQIEGFDLEVSQEAETYAALLGLVSAGLGFTIVTSSMTQCFGDDIAFVELVDPSVAVDYGLAMREGDEPVCARALLSVAEHLSRVL